MLYATALTDFTNGTHDWDSASQTYKVMLLTTGYTFSHSHVFVSDISAYELNGTNYTPGFSSASRKILTNRTDTTDTINGYSYLDCDDITYSQINAGTIGSAIVYRHLTSDANSKLVLQITGGPLPYLSHGGDVGFRWPTNGIIKIKNG